MATRGRAKGAPIPVGVDTPPRRLLVFSHLRWNFVFQRPQQLMMHARRDFDVTFFEEPVFNSGNDLPRLSTYSPAPGVEVITPYLKPSLDRDIIAHQQRLLLDEHVGHKRGELYLWYYTPMALAFSSHLTAALSVYDCMDELSAFRGAAPELPVWEDRLLGAVDLVFTGGRSLFEAKRDRHSDVHAFPSSIDAGHFKTARKLQGLEPADQAAIPRPRIGFFGVIDERMNLELVANLAAKRHDWQFVMLGPVVKIDPVLLPQGPNIHWLGAKAYNDLPRYLAGWKAGFMPFALNDATEFISPTKTPEFLSAGLPVVSTPIADVVDAYGRYGLVEVGAESSEFAKKLGEVMDRPRKSWLRDVDRRLSGTSWRETWRSMYALMSLARNNAAQEEAVRAAHSAEVGAVRV